jgi:carboxyl-terminal processing protease
MNRVANRGAVMTGIATVVAIMLAIGMVAGPAIAAGGMEQQSPEASYSPEQRRSMATKVWEDIKLRYSYFEDKDLDWDGIGQKYISLAETAGSDREFYSAVVEMVRQLHDGHSYVYGYPGPLAGEARGTTALSVAIVDDRPTVVAVRPGSDAETLGVELGMEIAEVGGVPAQVLLERLQSAVTASTPWYARAAAAKALLNGALSQTVEVKLVDGDGRSIVVELAREQSSRSVEPIEGRLLPGGVGYIRLSSFSPGNLGLGSASEFKEAFDCALEAVRGSEVLIIDVRGNGGGDDRLAGACARRLVSSATEFPGYQMRVVTFGKAWFTPLMRRNVVPRGLWQYRGPVVLLIDEFVFSSAEHFVAGLHDSGRAVTVGANTAGSSGNPVQRQAGGFRYQISRWREYRTTGELIEGGGIPADVVVMPTVEGVRAQRDEVLERAIEVARDLVGR